MWLIWVLAPVTFSAMSMEGDRSICLFKQRGFGIHIRKNSICELRRIVPLKTMAHWSCGFRYTFWCIKYASKTLCEPRVYSHTADLLQHSLQLSQSSQWCGPKSIHMLTKQPHLDVFQSEMSAANLPCVNIPTRYGKAVGFTCGIAQVNSTVDYSTGMWIRFSKSAEFFCMDNWPRSTACQFQLWIFTVNLTTSIRLNQQGIGSKVCMQHRDFVEDSLPKNPPHVDSPQYSNVHALDSHK